MQELAEPQDPEAQAFHVVVPSLPGFTFSSGPPTDKHGEGDVDGYCHLFDSLMRGLGYDRYAVQGGESNVVSKGVFLFYQLTQTDDSSLLHSQATGDRCMPECLLPNSPIQTVQDVEPAISTSCQCSPMANTSAEP